MLYARQMSWPDWWPTATAAILAVQVVFWLWKGESPAFTNYSIVSYFLLIILGAGIAGLNAVRSGRAIRLFWAFLAVSFVLWAISTWVWIYYLVFLRSPTQNSSLTDPPLFLHVVLIMAAIAVRPHLQPSRLKPYQATVDFLLLLYFWVFLYAYIQLPYSHTHAELLFILLYSAANTALLVFLVFLCLLKPQAPSAWKLVYWHLFGASALYACTSLASNLLLKSRGHRGGFIEIPLMAAMCWFVWVTLLGRRLAPRLEQSLQPDTGYTKRYLSFLAMLGVVAMPAVGLWELVRTGEPAEVRAFRLMIVLASVFLLALFALREYSAYQNLAADLSSAVSQRTQLEEERLKLSGRLIHAQEEERSRIARDLHDDLNQRLGLLAFGLAAISRRLPKEEANHLQDLWEQATSLSKDVHRLSHELHPSALEHLGLGGAARALCAEVSKQKKVNVEFSEKNIPVQLPAETSLCLFRILQESLNNVCKHSHARVASVKLARVREGIRLTVQDDGIGFDLRDEHNRAGLGLLSMNERLRLVGGRIAIDSVPGKGTKVKAWAAIKAAEAAGVDGPACHVPQASTRPERGESNEPRTATFG